LIALLGALIPIVGIILAVVAERLALSIPDSNGTAGKKKTVQLVAALAFLLSLGTGVLYYMQYERQQEQVAEQQATKTRAESEAQGQARQEASAREDRHNQLLGCMEEVNKRFSEVLALVRNADELNAVNVTKQQQMDLCKVRWGE
jgi:hypothetical protein